MALKIRLIEALPKGTIAREKLAAEIERAKADPLSKPTHFCCKGCGRNTPVTEVGRRYNFGAAVCKACHERARQTKDGSLRIRGGKLASVQKNRAKRAKKAYAAGRLPPWMFS